MSTKQPLKKVTLSDLSKAACQFGVCDLPSQRYADCLVIKFDGEAGNSHEHCGTFRFMSAMIAAGVAAWSPSTVVLDLTNLIYDWGDEMATILGGLPLPTAIIVADCNREGLTSLVEYEMDGTVSDWLFDTLEEALAACACKYAVEISKPMHNSELE